VHNKRNANSTWTEHDLRWLVMNMDEAAENV